MNLDDFENIRVDKNKLVKQNNEKIKSAGNYIEVNVCIGVNNEPILPIVDIHGVNIKEVTSMVLALENIIKRLEGKFPEIKFAKMFMDARMEDL